MSRLTLRVCSPLRTAPYQMVPSFRARFNSTSSTPPRHPSSSSLATDPAAAAAEPLTDKERARKARLTPGTPEWNAPPPPGLTPDEVNEEVKARAEIQGGTPPSMSLSRQTIFWIFASSTALYVAIYFGHDYLPHQDVVKASPLSPQWVFDRNQEAQGLPTRRLTEDEEREIRRRNQFKRLQFLAAQSELSLSQSGGNVAPPALDEIKPTTKEEE